MHVKGLELPAYDVRGAKAHGLNYATAFTGADHNKGYAFQEIFGIPIPEPVDRLAYEGKGRAVQVEPGRAHGPGRLPDMCVFLMDMAVADFMFENTANLMEAATGLTYTPEEVHQVGERINNLARVFNIKAGFTRADDDLPSGSRPSPSRMGLQGRAHQPERSRLHARRVLRRSGLGSRRRADAGQVGGACAWDTCADALGLRRVCIATDVNIRVRSVGLTRQLLGQGEVDHEPWPRGPPSTALLERLAAERGEKLRPLSRREPTGPSASRAAPRRAERPRHRTALDRRETRSSPRATTS